MVSDIVEANDVVFPETSLFDWLIAEFRIGTDSFILSEGEWFKISRDYFRKIERAFNAITSSGRGYRKVGTTTDKNETEYIFNYTVTAQEIILDKGLSYIYGVYNSIEICDIYNANREFIHIKDSGSSSKLSHLFNQGYVSCYTFLSDPGFATDLRSKLARKPALRTTINSPIQASRYTIVFRILKAGPTFSLPFFTKVVIEEMYRKVKMFGYRFRLEWMEKI
jgi:uncharacterized protein (TIGR04141 family)